MKQEIVGCQWHQLDHVQIICISFKADDHASTSSLNFLQAGCSAWCPINSVEALKAMQLKLVLMLRYAAFVCLRLWTRGNHLL